MLLGMGLVTRGTLDFSFEQRKTSDFLTVAYACGHPEIRVERRFIGNGNRVVVSEITSQNELLLLPNNLRTSQIGIGVADETSP